VADQSSKTIPPYVTWGVFKGTMDTLAETTLPSGPLDRRVLHTLSGADHGALMSALRFLGLADSENRATDKYSELIEWLKAPAGPEQFKEKFMALLDEKYKPILERVDLERGTISELEKAFREEMEVSPGQMMTKTIRFFVKAYTENGFNIMSPHITRPKPKARNTAKKTSSGDKTPKRSTRVQHQDRDDLETTPRGFSRLPIPGMADAFIQYPNDLTEVQCGLLDAATVLLRAYVKSQKGGGRKETAP
jgi:hypothetical protein